MLYNAVYDPDMAENLPHDRGRAAAVGRQGPAVRRGLRGLCRRHEEGAESKTVALDRQAPQLRDLRHPLQGDRHRPQGRQALEPGPYKEAVIAIDKVWGEPDTWATIKRSSSSYTPFYLLAHARPAPGRGRLHRAGAGGPRRSTSTFSCARSASSLLVTLLHADPRLSGRLHAGDDCRSGPPAS